MKPHILAVLILPALASGPKEANMNFTDFAGVASIESPEGWEVDKAEDAVDPSLIFSLGPDIIKARLLGGEGSRYASPAEYLKGFEATTMGKPPEKIRAIKVVGGKTWLYRHGYPMALGDPHVVGDMPPILAQEEFCIIPIGRKFLVLSWAHESAPDPEFAAEKAWTRFLERISLAKPRAR
ncbi:MAG TPA: hypothetical protein DEB40_11750 [Elusimicrobia bacterium]|nr:hypothetical protein [Elusimicrobiota bacterium]HBT62406.1 hypothetical protein [Elusimicrobiota bacterium]